MVRKGDIKLVDEIARRVGLSDDQRELLHEEFRRYYLEDLTYREILELARQIIEFRVSNVNAASRAEPRETRL